MHLIGVELVILGFKQDLTPIAVLFGGLLDICRVLKNTGDTSRSAEDSRQFTESLNQKLFYKHVCTVLLNSWIYILVEGNICKHR